MSTFRAANGTETCTLSDVAVRKCDGDWQGERWLYPSSTDKPIQKLPTRGSERRVGENMCVALRRSGHEVLPPNHHVRVFLTESTCNLTGREAYGIERRGLRMKGSR